MKILIVYDSMFGNTEKIAQAIGQSFAHVHEVTVARVGDTRPEHLKGVELLIVGSPTQGFRPTLATTNFLKSIPDNSLKGVMVLAFDTRVAQEDIPSSALRFMVNIVGYAAQPIANQLKKKGGDLILPAEGFYVGGKEGPLKDGELDRAAHWVKLPVSA